MSLEIVSIGVLLEIAVGVDDGQRAVDTPSLTAGLAWFATSLPLGRLLIRHKSSRLLGYSTYSTLRVIRRNRLWSLESRFHGLIACSKRWSEHQSG